MPAEPDRNTHANESSEKTNHGNDDDNGNGNGKDPPPVLLRDILPPEVPTGDQGCERAVCVRLYLIRHGQTDWNRAGRVQGGGYDVPLNATGRLQAKRAGKALGGIPLDLVVSSGLSRASETADLVALEVQALAKKSGSGNHHNGCSPARVVDKGFNEMRFGALEGIKGTRGRACSRGGEDRLWERARAAKEKVRLDPDCCFPATLFGEDDACGDDDDEAAEKDKWRVLEGTREGESTRMVQERSLRALSRVLSAVPGGERLGGTDTTKNTEKRVYHVAVVGHGRTNKVLLAAMLHGEAQGRYSEIQQGNACIYVLDLREDALHNQGNGNDTRGLWKPLLVNHTQHVLEPQL